VNTQSENVKNSNINILVYVYSSLLLLLYLSNTGSILFKCSIAAIQNFWAVLQRTLES